MTQNVLVVLENEEVCLPAIAYARELAKRLDAEVTLLMVVEMAFLDNPWLGAKRNAIHELDQRAGALLTGLTGEFIGQGISTTVAIRLGDPAQELCKFLAEHPPAQVLIWGSGEELPPAGRKTHWMTKAARSLECPLWTVAGRRPPTARTQGLDQNLPWKSR